jgi:hypothetical protein
MHRKPDEPEWLAWARDHATEYLHRFANNPGVARIVHEFDTHFEHIKDPNERLDYLQKLAAEHWDYRKGRERFEIVANEPMDQPGDRLGQIVYEGTSYMEMYTRSTATLKHYSIMAILGGANKSPYNRLRYALEQDITYDMLAYLGSERELLPPEREQTKEYAPGAQTEFDLGKGAILSLMEDQLGPEGEGEYELLTSEWRITHLQKQNGVPVVLLSAPPFLGVKRANTADTYDFLRRLEQEALTHPQNILFVTASVFRYAQYFDAVREITLRTGVDIETIGYEPSYTALEYKPSQVLQELKAAADAAVRLRDAVQGNEERNEWRQRYYDRFKREESMRPPNSSWT